MRHYIMATDIENKTFEERFDMLMQSFEELRDSQKEAEKQRKERAAEAEKQNAEWERERKERAAEAEKRNAEWEKRSAKWERERKERNAEWERERKERNAEWEKKSAETAERTKKIEENFEKLGKYINSVCGDVEGMKKSNGLVAEEFIYNALAKDMTFGGVVYDDITRNMKRKSKSQNLEGEFDVVLTNGDTLLIIEAKQKVRRDDVSKLITKPSDFRILFPMYNDYKILLGIGGLCFENDVIEDAQNQGIGIIKVDSDKIECHTDNLKMY